MERRKSLTACILYGYLGFSILCLFLCLIIQSGAFMILKAWLWGSELCLVLVLLTMLVILLKMLGFKLRINRSNKGR